jgi:hypothetical protein
MRQPESWGFAPDGALARAVRDVGAGEHVLVAGAGDEAAALFSAAHGCAVTALIPEPELLDRVFAAADAAGVGSQVRGCVCGLGGWAPDVPLRVVVCSAQAFDGLGDGERADAVDELRRATAVGGVHLLRSTDATRPPVSLDEWRTWYGGWVVTSEGDGACGTTYRAQYVASQQGFAHQASAHEGALQQGVAH